MKHARATAIAASIAAAALVSGIGASSGGASPTGQIVTHGLQGMTSSFEVAVIGGTGAYAGARGTMTAHPIKDGGSTILINLL